MTSMKSKFLATMALVVLAPLQSWAQDPDAIAAVRNALTFSASFDHGSDADFAKGDKRIYTAASAERKEVKPGLPAGEFEVVPAIGRNGGGALRFIQRSNKVAFYQASRNLDYRQQDWSGTVSFWLSLDPQTDLGDWYCDPIQITDKTWNDAALWVDFSKDDKPKHFRLGALADLKVWNPGNLDFEKLAPAERPVVVVTKAPFTRSEWTHVVITFEKFNTGKADSAAQLYLNGVSQGSVSGRNQTYTWNPEKAAIQIGMSYVGLYDELTLYDRALSASEVKLLYSLKAPLIAP